MGCGWFGILWDKIVIGLRGAVFIWAAEDLDRVDEISVRWRGWCLPIQSGCFPWIIRMDFFAMGDAVEEVDDKWNLSQTKTPGGDGNRLVEFDVFAEESDDASFRPDR